MKVDYLRARPKHWRPEGKTELQVVRGLPFFLQRPASYVHRVRSAEHHLWDGVWSHTSLSFWCGGTGSIANSQHPRGWRSSFRKLGRFLAEVPAGEVLCATCEGRAIGTGMLGAPVICGRAVRFSPRV